MSYSTCLPGRRSDFALDIQQLPADAQALVCSLASTPSRPSHLLLARVSKAWGAVAAEHFHTNGCSVELVLPCDIERLREHEKQAAKRLLLLAKWLQQDGQFVTSLAIEPKGTAVQHGHCWFQGHHTVANILTAIQALAEERGVLRLQQLSVPALGASTCEGICKALSGCGQLRALRLGSTSGSSAMDYLGNHGGRMLAMALRQLQQLTSLSLHCGSCGSDDYYDAQDHMNTFISALPSRLVALELRYVLPGEYFEGAGLHTTSLRHLVALQQLRLMDVVCSSSTAGPAHDLAPLTALTSLSMDVALRPGNEALLSVPNLVQLSTVYGFEAGMEALAGKASLRSLSFTFLKESAAALAQMTQLTQLSVQVPLGAKGCDQPVPTSTQMCAQALSSLTGLRSLAVQPEVLQQVQMSAMSALQHLTVDLRQSHYTPEQVEGLLLGLPPSLEVEVVQACPVVRPVARRHGGSVPQVAVIWGDSD
jgi:hypothetical protein